MNRKRFLPTVTFAALAFLFFCFAEYGAIKACE